MIKDCAGHDCQVADFVVTPGDNYTLAFGIIEYIKSDERCRVRYLDDSVKTIDNSEFLKVSESQLPEDKLDEFQELEERIRNQCLST